MKKKGKVLLVLLGSFILIGIVCFVQAECFSPLKNLSDSKQVSTDYRWECKSEGCRYDSHRHFLKSTAAKYAIAHHMKYGHSVIEYSK